MEVFFFLGTFLFLFSSGAVDNMGEEVWKNFTGGRVEGLKPNLSAVFLSCRGGDGMGPRFISRSFILDTTRGFFFSIFGSLSSSSSVFLSSSLHPFKEDVGGSMTSIAIPILSSWGSDSISISSPSYCRYCCCSISCAFCCCILLIFFI